MPLVSLLPRPSLPLLEQIRRAGGTAILVGGAVRDWLLGVPARDIDIEVHGLEAKQLTALLAQQGKVQCIGQAFGVLRTGNLDIDFSLPRRDSKQGPGHTDFAIFCDPHMGFARAARRRDFTVNSMGFNLHTQTLLDPVKGLDDLRQGILRATDPQTFGDDPLRALRAAAFCARYSLRPDTQLVQLCAQMSLVSLSQERLQEVWWQLLHARAPGLGLQLLYRTDLLRFFPSLAFLLQAENLDTCANILAAAHTARLLPAARWALVGLPCVICQPADSACTACAHILAWMTALKTATDLQRRSCALLRAVCDIFCWPTPYTVRTTARFLAKYDLGMDSLIQMLIYAQQAGALRPWFLAFIQQTCQRLGLWRATDIPKFSGQHAKAMGAAPGPAYSQAISALERMWAKTGLSDTALLRRTNSADLGQQHLCQGLQKK